MLDLSDMRRMVRKRMYETRVSSEELCFWARRQRFLGSTSELGEGNSWDEVSMWARCSVNCAKWLAHSLNNTSAA